MKEKSAFFPGSFDPITLGHIEIIERGLDLFDKVIIGIGINSQKKSMFSVSEREKWVRDCFGNNKKIEVISYEGLTVDMCKSLGIRFILRGLRTSGDFDFESSVARTNKELSPDVETCYLISSPENVHISSTIVRELIKYKGDISRLVPKAIIGDIHLL
jgi:pantetheine-phosphate adenylyltransferase